MIAFEQLWHLASERKGGDAALEALLEKPEPQSALQRLTDDRWLASMTKRVFQAGFNWSVIENKWPGFEEAFEGFEPRRWRMMSDDDFERLMKDTRIVRNGQKILSVRDNATFLVDLAEEHGSAAKIFAEWPRTDYVGLVRMLGDRGSRLGGSTAQYLLRGMGVDAFILSRDVTAALIREDVIEKASSSKRAMQAIQAAFNTWSDESGRSLTEISRVLAFTVPGEHEHHGRGHVAL